ncbi:MAG TPA: hypothetical protein VM555_01810, partial [Tahibacter sp.]|nr:hypothetical protein [Tahibacter sp.]
MIAIQLLKLQQQRLDPSLRWDDELKRRAKGADTKPQKHRPPDPTMPTLTTIAFDADDTLWQNEHFYRLTERRFTDLLADYGDADAISHQLLQAEKKNLLLYGYGIK